MNLKRLAKHLFLPSWWVQRGLTAADLAAIESAVAESEKKHRGELRIVFEGPLPWFVLWRYRTARERAAQLFAQLGVWDTEDNSGLLIYIQLVDHHIEILADRGITRCVAQTEWDALCASLAPMLKQKNYREAGLLAVSRAGALLVRYFPARADNPNELPNQPVRL